MMLKTFHVTLGVLAALSYWGVALIIASLIAIIGLHVVVIGGLTMFHLLHS